TRSGALVSLARIDARTPSLLMASSAIAHRSHARVRPLGVTSWTWRAARVLPRASTTKVPPGPERDSSGPPNSEVGTRSGPHPGALPGATRSLLPARGGSGH